MAETKHLRSKSEVQKYVHQNFKVDRGFTVELPISVLNLISEGIIFSVHKWVNVFFNFK
jgi:hypothetical protein